MKRQIMYYDITENDIVVCFVPYLSSSKNFMNHIKIVKYGEKIEGCTYCFRITPEEYSSIQSLSSKKGERLDIFGRSLIAGDFVYLFEKSYYDLSGHYGLMLGDEIYTLQGLKHTKNVYKIESFLDGEEEIYNNLCVSCNNYQNKLLAKDYNVGDILLGKQPNINYIYLGRRLFIYEDVIDNDIINMKKGFLYIKVNKQMICVKDLYKFLLSGSGLTQRQKDYYKVFSKKDALLRVIAMPGLQENNLLKSFVFSNEKKPLLKINEISINGLLSDLVFNSDFMLGPVLENDSKYSLIYNKEI